MNNYIMAAVMFTAVIFMTLVHEAAHMLTAKAFKIPVVEFAIGFGPKIFSKKAKETTYSLRLLPFGGYCSFTDPDDGGSKLDRAVSDKNLYSVPSWQRAAVLLAGPLSNILLAVICFGISGLSLISGINLMFEITKALLVNIGSLINPATLTQGGMVAASFQMARMVMGTDHILRAFWIVSGCINFLLGLTNLVPFPALDGFSALWAIAETVAKKKFSQRVEGKLKMIGMLVIYAMIFMCCIGDIIHTGSYF